MKKIGITTAGVFVFCTVLVSSARLFAGDLKVKSLVTFTNKTSDTYKSPESTRSSQHEETVYAQGSRMRRDYRVPDTADASQPHTAEIEDCRTLSMFRVDLNAHEYAEMKLTSFPDEKLVHAFTRQQKEWARKRYATRTINTGEHKTFFGLTASHIITTVHGITSSDRSEATIDGWYVNLPEPVCGPDYMRREEAQVSFLQAKVTKNVYTGFVAPGLAVQEIITTHSRFEQKGHDIEIVSVMEKKVVELSQEALDPALFSVPEGFGKVDQLPRNVNMPRPALQTR